MALTIFNRDGTAKNSEPGFAPQSVVARVYRAGAQTSIGLTATNIPFDAKSFDPFGFYDTTTYRFQPKVAGYYSVNCQLLFTGIVGGQRVELHIAKNGSNVYRMADATANAADWGVNGSGMVYLNGSTDYVNVVSIITTTARNFYSGESLSYAEFSLVGTSVGVAPEPWHLIGALGEPGFQNSWTNWGAAPNPQAGFKKTPDGTIHLKGRLKGGNSSSTAFTLPTGYRPTDERRITGSPNLVFIQANGDVSIWGTSSPITETNIEVSFQP